MASVVKRRVRAAVLASVSIVGAFSGCASPPARPNIVLFMVDTLRADALGCYGQPVFKTPRIDGFAATGVRFTNAFAQSSWTRDAVAAVFTGHYDWAHGVTGRRHRLPAALPTLAELLTEAGYRTAAVVANPNLDGAFGFDRGFSRYVRTYAWDGDGRVPQRDAVTRARDVVNAAVSWMATERTEPFFLYVLAVDPHQPYAAPAPH
jgi:arylsulfatase A-like enzyme